MSLSEQERIRNAEHRVDAQIGFGIHLIVYVAVIALLVVIDWGGGAGWWVQWPLIGWGLGILLHAVLVFSQLPDRLSRWRLRRIDRVRRQQ